MTLCGFNNYYNMLIIDHQYLNIIAQTKYFTYNRCMIFNKIKFNLIAYILVQKPKKYFLGSKCKNKDEKYLHVLNCTVLYLI